MKEDYLERLQKCGFTMSAAQFIYNDLMERSIRCPEYDLDDFIEEMEAQPCG